MTLPDVVVCVDPGKMSGIGLIYTNGPKYVDSIEVRPEDFGPTLAKCLHEFCTPRPDGYVYSVKMVCESFTITPGTAKNTSAPWSLENIGIVKYLADVYGIGRDNVAFQSPSTAKSFCDNAKLRRLELWHRAGAGHANDALRHGVTWMARQGWTDSRLLSSAT